MYNNDTICALATGTGVSAIAIIRISGEKAFTICEKVFVPKRKNLKLSESKSHRIYFGTINNNDEIVDDVWLKVIPNPATTNVNLNYHFVSNSQTDKTSRMIKITDAVGQIFLLQKLAQTEGVYKLNVSQFRQGVYFVELLENNLHLKTERFVVNH